MTYSNPKTLPAIVAYAKETNVNVLCIERKVDNYRSTMAFLTGEEYHSRWATNILTEGSQVVLYVDSKPSIVPVIHVGKTTVKVRSNGKTITFNRDGMERGHIGVLFQKQIVEFNQTIFDIVTQEHAHLQEQYRKRTELVNRVKNKSLAIAQSNNINSKLTDSQLDRLAALYAEFDEENKGMGSEAA